MTEPSGQADDVLEGMAQVRAEREQRVERRRLLREEEAALYRDENGRPVLRRSFAMYLDELGTSQRAKTLTDDELATSLLAQEGLRYFLDHDDGYGHGDRRVLAFSDNVVVGVPFVQRRFHADGDLHLHLSSVAAYQFNMAVRGRFLRGGVAVGPLYIDGSHVAGSALVDAVQLEHAVAMHPRVVLSPECVELTLAERRGWSGPWPSTLAGDVLLVDADGQVFINYVRVAAADEDWPDEHIAQGLAEHRNRVQEGLASHASDQRIRPKYVWAAQLHNAIARAITEGDEFAVTEGLLTAERTRPRLFRPLGRDD